MSTYVESLYFLKPPTSMADTVPLLHSGLWYHRNGWLTNEEHRYHMCITIHWGSSCSTCRCVIFFFFKAIASSIPISCHWLRYHKNPEYVGKMQVFNECIQRPWSGWKVDELNETRWSFQLSKPIFTVCFVTSVVKSDHPKCRKPFSFQKEPSQTCGSQGKPSNRQIFSKTMLPETNSSRLKMDDWKLLSFWGPAHFQVLSLLVSADCNAPEVVTLTLFFGPTHSLRVGLTLNRDIQGSLNATHFGSGGYTLVN